VNSRAFVVLQSLQSLKVLRGEGPTIFERSEGFLKSYLNANSLSSASLKAQSMSPYFKTDTFYILFTFWHFLKDICIPLF